MSIWGVGIRSVGIFFGRGGGLPLEEVGFDVPPEHA